MRERGTEWGEWVKVVQVHVALEVGGLQAKNPSLLHSSNHVLWFQVSICPEESTIQVSGSHGQ